MKNGKKRLLLLLIIAILTLYCIPINVFAIGSDGYSNDEYSTNPKKSWHHGYIDTQAAWDLLDKYVPNNKKIVIASVDSGCNVTLSDLVGNLDTKNCVKIDNGQIISYQYMPKFTHGTVLASVIAATSNNYTGVAGVAAGNRNNIAKLMCINVSTETMDYFVYGKRRDTTTQNIIDGLNYAADHGARVIHMCLGHDKTYKDANNDSFDYDKIQNEISKILDAHPEIIMIASAGNKNSTKTWYVSDFDGVVSVINSSKFTNIYDKSTKYKTSNYGMNKTICAPGNGVSAENTAEEVAEHGGTSTASAVAAGVAALVLYANPDLTGKQVKDVLIAGAIDLYKDGFDKYTANGNINAYNSVIEALRRTGKYNDLPEMIKSIKDENMKSVKLKASVTGKKVNFKWKKSSSSLGKINQYKLYVSKSKDGEYKKVKTINSNKTKYTYTSKKKGTYYFKIRPCGTSKYGKRLLPADDGNSNIIKVKIK